MMKDITMSLLVLVVGILLACESHGHAKYDDDGRQSLLDMFGEMHYSVHNVAEVDGIIAESLKGLMHLQPFNQSMIDEIPIEG